MRTPLFVTLRYARQCALVPEDLKHSGILSLEHMRAQDRRLWTYVWDAPSGTEIIDEIADRIHRQAPVKESVFCETRIKVARRIYTSGSPLTNYINRHRFNQCGGEIALGVRIGGAWTGWTSDPLRAGVGIEIKPVPMKPCRWCGKRIEFKPSWVDHHGRIRCNAPDCRRMSYLEHTPQSRGGIDLTPNQRKHLSWEAQDGQKAINYLMLRLKELKHGRSTNHDLR